MTYNTNSKVEASDYNNLIVPVNKLYSTGKDQFGLGQITPTLTNISVGTTVDNTEWDNLRTVINTVANHQGTSITPIPAFNEGDIITYLATVSSALTSIINNNKNAVAQGTTSGVTTPYTHTWSNLLTYTHVITFENGDSARYFFNAGGQIALTFAKTGSQPIDVIWQELVTKIGTLYISAGGPVGTETSKIAGTTYRGFQQISSSSQSGSARTTYDQRCGYYYLPSSTPITAFQQYATPSTASYAYNLSNIQVLLKTNGPQGLNGDNGSTITITTIWDEVPDGLVASLGTTVTVTVRPPSTSYITNTWGNVTVSGSVTGS